MNTLVSPAELLPFGQFADEFVDAAAAGVRGDADWHIAPRMTETVRVVLRGGERDTLVLPHTRDMAGAPVVVNSVTGNGVLLGGWDYAEGCVVRSSLGWRAYRSVLVSITHGFVTCPPDLLPVLATRAQAAKSPRDSRVSSFTNGAIQMAFGDLASVDPTIARYAVIGGVA